MERRLHHLALLLGLLAWAAAAATGAEAQPVCDPSIIATQIALFCMPDMPTAPCCEPIIASVDLGGGIPCLCRVAAQPQLVLARLNATHLLALYASCGGQHTGGAHLAAACQGPSPPAATVPVVAPPPPAAPRHKQPTREAPPPPPQSEKPSPSPQQQPGAAATAHGKAIPTSPAAAFTQLAPAAAPTMPTPPHSGSDKGPIVVSAAFLFFVIAVIIILD
ncbi:non-specific lipid-transfer protein EPAD1-like [Miscanthus floridulus]|uniref:non-specific lipid-transfer protein EPAD1-like n=1 Tax=Miscanthus floridulus TaxID=154761 RepID=UPI00345A1897